MPHFPKPFFRPKRNRWFVQLDGKQINLGADEEAAFRRYHELMANHKERPAARPGKPQLFVVVALDLFLEWCQKHKAKRTYDWYRAYLQSFATSSSDSLTVADLRPFHVQQWIDSHPGWKTGKRGAITAVQRALNWAIKFGHIAVNPIHGMEKPAQGVREQVVSEGEFQELLPLVDDQEFRDLVEAAWETGARPNELFVVEARHVDLAEGRWIYSVTESKGRKHQRVIYLTDKALAITRRLMAAHPTGKLFRNTDGQPWTRHAVNCRFGRLRFALGRKRMRERGMQVPKIPRLTKEQQRDPRRRAEHEQQMLARRQKIKQLARANGTRYSLYAFRHSWCTHALASGRLDAITVATLMGHKDCQMISRVYGHLLQRSDHLRNAIKKARGA